jgi:hypothetical protein
VEANEMHPRPEGEPPRDGFVLTSCLGEYPASVLTERPSLMGPEGDLQGMQIAVQLQLVAAPSAEPSTLRLRPERIQMAACVAVVALVPEVHCQYSTIHENCIENRCSISWNILHSIREPGAVDRPGSHALLRVLPHIPGAL